MNLRRVDKGKNYYSKLYNGKQTLNNTQQQPSNKTKQYSPSKQQNRRQTVTSAMRTIIKREIDKYKWKQKQKNMNKMMDDIRSIAQRCLKRALKGGRNGPTITSGLSVITPEQYLFLRRHFIVRGGKARRNELLFQQLNLHTAMRSIGGNRFVKGYDLHFSIYRKKNEPYQTKDYNWYSTEGQCSFIVKCVQMDDVD
ncbi:unnamed protein product [Didymodactylos carnosus]|uniref:Uncharacterized protein n=1 Tax=Didymodactylos carnosus TaxID=1234261 RepID=A0A815X2T1_9BILA|nr:unnamed protein product [Didymodactylos carnosus]CAF4410872.1 unnamed protein product [Didymodactylos carnosus]